MEIMIVFMIMGVFIAFAMPSFDNYLDKQEYRKAIRFLHILYNSQKIYKVKNNKYFEGCTYNYSVFMKSFNIHPEYSFYEDWVSCASNAEDVDERLAHVLATNDNRLPVGTIVAINKNGQILCIAGPCSFLND